MQIQIFKSLLRDMDLHGDAWGVAMGAYFDVMSMAYERLGHWEWVEFNEIHHYRPGAMGNQIEVDSYLYQFIETATNQQLMDAANLLYRYTEMLKKSGKSY